MVKGLKYLLQRELVTVIIGTLVLLLFVTFFFTRKVSWFTYLLIACLTVAASWQVVEAFRNPKSPVVSFRALLFTVALIGALVLLFASIYSSIGLQKLEGGIEKGLKAGLYFSVITWTGLGYGDLYPSKNLRVVATSETLLGYVFMALLIGLILNLIRRN